ncbi:MAG: S-methyl-5'-thioinosine phosphorylase [Pseudomonadota bacterium]
MGSESVAIIGGTGLDSIDSLQIQKRHNVVTAFGPPSDDIQQGTLFDTPILFLPRHGESHQIPPHKINYRANIAALAKFMPKKILSVTAVGGITDDAQPRAIVIPEQIIDYTSGREQTFFDGKDRVVEHIDFTEPFCSLIRQELVDAAGNAGVAVTASGVYGVTQGPRLETAAEIRRLRADGCSVVGMTAMPEAALARELNLPYANCSIVVNWAAGIEQREITMSEIRNNLQAAHGQFIQLLGEWLRTP